MKTSLLALALPVITMLATGCSAETPSDEASVSTDALSNAKVKLPANDVCRDVLAPLALGLADSSAGLDYTRGITVSLTSETDTRLYTVSVAAPWGPANFEVELDNDSASLCLLLSAKQASRADLANDRKTSMNGAERNVNAPVIVTPADDDCAETVRQLALGAAVSAVGESRIEGVSVAFQSYDENRYYTVHIDGRDFTANGHTFANDYDFTLETSNDSASKCWLQDLHLGSR